MSKRLRNVVNFDASFFTPIMTVEVAEEMALGTLVGLNAEGKAVKANGDSVLAVGVVYKTSPESFGEAFKLNGVGVIKVGDFMDIHPFAVVENVDELTGVKVGEPVFAAAEGKMAKAGTQKVGIVAHAEKKIVRLMII